MASAVTLLPQPELADDAQRLAGIDGEADAADGLGAAAAIPLEDDAQIGDGKKGGHS